MVRVYPTNAKGERDGPDKNIEDVVWERMAHMKNLRWKKAPKKEITNKSKNQNKN